MEMENTIGLTDEQSAKLFNAVAEGLPIADAVNLAPEVLEGLYSLAFNFYSTANYKDAETIFKALCVYKYTDYRFWMGLGGCRQALGEYQLAVETYGMASLIEQLKNPEPLWYAANCYVKLNDKENALAILDSILILSSENNPSHLSYRAKAEALRTLLQQANAS